MHSTHGTTLQQLQGHQHWYTSINLLCGSMSNVTVWSAICKNLWGQWRQCMYDMPSLILYVACHVLYIYAMFYIFMPSFIYLWHDLYIYVMFYIFMLCFIPVYYLCQFQCMLHHYWFMLHQDCLFLLYCLLSFMLYQHKFTLHVPWSFNIHIQGEYF